MARAAVSGHVLDDVVLHEVDVGKDDLAVPHDDHGRCEVAIELRLRARR